MSMSQVLNIVKQTNMKPCLSYINLACIVVYYCSCFFHYPRSIDQFI